MPVSSVLFSLKKSKHIWERPPKKTWDIIKSEIMSISKKVKGKKTWFEKIKLVYDIFKFLFDLFILIRKMMGLE